MPAFAPLDGPEEVEEAEEDLIGLAVSVVAEDAAAGCRRTSLRGSMLFSDSVITLLAA